MNNGGTMNVRVHTGLRLFAVAGLLISLLLSALVPWSKVWAAGEVFTGGSAVNGVIGSDIEITDLQIGGTGNDTLPVNLYVSSGSLEMGTSTGLTFVGSSSGQNLQFSGTRSNINAALATLVYTPALPGAVTIEAALVTDDEVYNPLNGHVYKVVNEDEGITWDDAYTDANALERYGADGYLVTITSEEEDQFLVERLSDDGWMGASDIEDDGDWKWINGPEEDTSFWSGVVDGVPIGESYVNWRPSQPDNADDNEHCGQIVVDGGSTGWNDLPCDSELDYYVVEFGDDEPLDLATDTITVNVTGAEQTIESCDDWMTLADDEETNRLDTITLTDDIDCDGESVYGLYDEDQPFEGIFDGNGHTIRNVSISDDIEDMGLFNYAINATFRDITLENIVIEGGEDVGALVGDVRNSLIENIMINNVELSAEDGYIGALSGNMEAEEGGTMTVRKVGATGYVFSEDSNAGGLIGWAGAWGGGTLLIEQVYSEVDVEVEDENDDIGGLLGELDADTYDSDENSTSTLQDAYAWGEVYAPDSEDVGGLIGQVDVEPEDTDAIITIQRTYASGDVTGYYGAGGLLGIVEEMPENGMVNVRDSFAKGAVAADYIGSDTGGLIGRYENEGAAIVSTNNYYDQAGTGQEVCDNEGSLNGCTAVNTSGTDSNYFINNNARQPMASWNFSTIWMTNPGIPPIFRGVPYPNDDGDNVSNLVENNAPNDGDANNDGTPDSEQPNVSSFANSVSGHYTTVAVGEDCILTEVAVATESSKSAQDAGYNYNTGLVNFTADCGTPGYTTTVELFVYGANAAGLVLRKYNPNTNAYFGVTGSTLTNVTIGSQSAVKTVYQIVDGGTLDIDATANGIIVDPVGLASATVSAPNTGFGITKQN